MPVRSFLCLLDLLFLRVVICLLVGKSLRVPFLLLLPWVLGLLICSLLYLRFVLLPYLLCCVLL